MESGTDSASSVLIPVAEYSDVFKRKILAPLQNAYLYEESKMSFRYKSASFVQNPLLKQKYAAFRAKRKQAGYSEDDLEETYGFLLFDDVNKVNALGQTGVLTGTSSCSSLGDPMKGVYISMLSDCLSPERWQDGQSGYIAIIKLTTGRVKRVSENHTQDLSAPTVGFDCHVSQHLASVTTRTSFSLAFERTQCYIYELLDDGSNQTASSPSLTCPFAVVAFSYQKIRALAMKEPKPCGFISYEILRILPVLRLAKGEVKKTSTDPNKGLCDVVASRLQTYTVLLNNGPASSPSLVPANHDTDGLLSSSKVDLQKGSKDPLKVEKTLTKLNTSTIKAKSETTVASKNLHVLNKTDDPGVKTPEAVDVPTQLCVSVTSEQSVTEESAVSAAKLETSSGETKDGSRNATNESEVIDKNGGQNAEALQTPDLAVRFTSEKNPVPSSQMERTSTGETTAEGNAADDMRVLNETDDPVVKSLKTADIPAELIVSFTSEQSVTGTSPIAPVITKTPSSAKRRRAPDCRESTSLTKKQRGKLLRKNSNSKKTIAASFGAPRLEKLQKSLKDSRLRSQTEQKKPASKIDWEKLRSRVMKERKIKTVNIESVNENETNPERRTRYSTKAIDRESPLREKFERWLLKPVISECGRVLVPHGSSYMPQLPESASVEQFPTAAVAPDAVEVERRLSVAPELPSCETLIPPQTGSTDQSTIQDSLDGEDPVQPQSLMERANPSSPDQRATKDEPADILSRRKTTKHQLDLFENPQGSTAETEPCLKKNRVDCNITSTADTAMELQENSTMSSANPAEMSNQFGQKGVEDTQRRQDVVETQGKKAQIISRPPSIYPKWNRIKTLRKHLDISQEHFKKTWWMHFQRPPGANETVKDHVRDFSLRKKTPTSTQSTDALNLLADLALGATGEEVPSQSDPEIKRELQSGLSDNPKNVTGAGEVPVLHSLLEQARPTPQDLSLLMEGIELVHFLWKEHAYSLPPSASIPSGLPGTPFQVPPLSGSSGLLLRSRARNGVQTSQAQIPKFSLEDLNENKNCLPSGHLGKRMNVFKCYRSFACKNGSVQVTRQWKEKYDFGRDSRFSSDPKDRTVIRALHGPWDFSIQDTSKDMKLIVHMWIGFFYSRSTPRFIDLGSEENANRHSEEGSYSEAEITAKAQSGPKVDPFGLPRGVENTSEPPTSNSLDLSGTSLDQESVILDLSLGNANRFENLSSDAQVSNTKVSDSPSPPTGLTEQSYQTTLLSAETPNEPQCMHHTTAPSLKEDVAHMQGSATIVSVETENHGIVIGMDQELRKSKMTDKVDLKAGSKNDPDALEPIRLLKDGRDSAFTEKALYKKEGDLSPMYQLDDKESKTFCNANLLAREQPEAEQIENLRFSQDCSNKNNNRFVQSSDEKDHCISTAEFSSDLRVQPLSIVRDCEDSEIGHATQPYQEFLTSLPQTNAESQSTTVCQSNTKIDHTASVYACDSVSKVGITDNTSTFENISPINCKMAVFTPQAMYIVGTESLTKAKNAFNFGEDKNVAVIAPIRQELLEGGQNKVLDRHGGVIIPLSGFSGKRTKLIDAQTDEFELNHSRTSSPKSSQEFSMSNVSTLKLGEPSQPDIAEGLDVTTPVNVHKNSPSIAQNHLNNLHQSETIKPGTKVALAKKGDDKVEEIHRELSFPLRRFSGENASSTGPRSQIEKTVRKRTETEMSTSFSKSVGEPLLCSLSVIEDAETSNPDRAGSLEANEKFSNISLNHQHSHLIQYETLNHVRSDVEFISGGRDMVKEIHCAVTFPLGGSSRERAQLTDPQRASKEAARNQSEMKGPGSPKSVVEPWPCRISVVKVGETSRLDTAFDYKSSPISLDSKPKSVACSVSQNDVSPDVSYPNIQQKSSPTGKCSKSELCNITHSLGQPSNSKDKTNSQTLRADPSDRTVVTMPFKTKADENHLDAPTSRMKSWKRKSRFYIVVTSEESFFSETKACLEEAGHAAVQPSQFFLDDECSPLIIIIKNEDLSARLSQVPHLLQLKKSPDVLFAGIDEPHDVVNLTHQELFVGGGFVMVDRSSLESLSLDKVKRFLEVLQELNKTGKWKWLLHYRDSRRLKENARFSAEEVEKQHLLGWAQETGLCAILSYHECDAKSKDHPDYLACLVHLQVQDIAARFPVFVTDTRTADEFEKNGILTTTVDSFLMRFST